MASKLHELLAVERSLKTQAEATRTDLVNTFEKKVHHFSEKRQLFEPYEENAQVQEESVLKLQSTIQKELAWVSKHIAAALDIGFQVSVANTQARGDVVLENGTPILLNVPATALLEMETRLSEVMALAKAIPTLDPAKGFELDTTRENGVYKAREEVKVRTKKTKKSLCAVSAHG